MPDEDGTSLPKKWPVKNIVYLSIIGPLMIAAFIEWILFLAAFIYCLVKVYHKADKWSIRALAVVIIIVFSLLRGIFLPVMIATFPLPPQIIQHFPIKLVYFFHWFSFWAFAAHVTLPWLFCIHRLVTNSIGRIKMIKEVLDDHNAPRIVVVMPVYREEPDVLIKAVDSVVNSDYPATCIHLFLSYDGGNVDESYLQVISHLGVPLSLQSYPQSIDVTYKGSRITISRFKHGGKRHCQKQTFKLIDKVYANYLLQRDDLFMLFIDSDCMLDTFCLQNFMYEMDLKPGSKHSILAMAGIITSTTEKNSLITVLQDMEYIHGQLFERSVESGCGAVTCLPGALTMLRFSAFRKIAKYYFADKAEQCEDLFDYGKCYLGEDRWLTHLFMVGAKKRYQIQMCTSAFCKTEAVQTFGSLLKQRRRWFLGFITNEACMLTDVRLWRRYPLLCLVRLMQNTIRTTALLFFILFIAIITAAFKVHDLPIGFIMISLGLNYALMVYFGAKLKRFKAWLYPLMFILNPFFNWIYMVYGIFTAGKRTWGGPRTDTAVVGEATTPEQAITQRDRGDEFNVEVETLRLKVEQKKVPVQPPEKISGRLSTELMVKSDDIETGLTSGLSPLPPAPQITLHPSVSTDSVFTSESITLPQTLESFVKGDEREKLDMTHQVQETTALLPNGDTCHDADNAEGPPFLQPSDTPDGTWPQELTAYEPPVQNLKEVAPSEPTRDVPLKDRTIKEPKRLSNTTDQSAITRSLSYQGGSRRQSMSKISEIVKSKSLG